MGKATSAILACIAVIILAGGCSMCAQCDLDSYGAYGGRWHRTDRDHGRVGSLYQPAGAQVPYDDTVIEEEPAAEEQPELADEEETLSASHLNW